MSRTRLLDFARWASFGVLLLLAVVLRERPSQVFDQAIIWVPTGVAIAGVYLLGYRAALVVAVVTVLQRLLLGYSWAIVWPAGMGSAAEAVLGAFLLKRLGVHPACSRLRDVAVVLVVAAAAPLGSIFFSWIGRAYGQWPAELPFYSGWDGWWRMNALGALAVVPFALTWMGVKWSEWTPRFVGLLALSCAGIGAVIFGALTVVPHGTSGILWLNLVLLPIVMYAAARFGVRATTFASSLAALTVAVATANGHGPFLQVVKDQRHVAVQLFELAFLAVPLAFGALIAERRAAEARGVRSDALRRSLQAALPDISYRLARDGTCLEVHVPTGVTPPVPPDKMVGRSIFDWFADPVVAEQFRAGMREAFDANGPATIEFETLYQGRSLYREARCVRHGEDEVLAVVRDISDRKWSERTTAFEARVLGLVAAGHSSIEVYSAIVHGLEELLPGAMCSILELNGRNMHVAVADSLPATYNAVIEGMEIGPGEGSCGSAAHFGRTVVVQEIASSPLWVKWRGLALESGLHACWSVPIRDSAGTVLGTCAVYHGEIREPRRRELELAERAAAMTGIVLERARRIEALRRSQDLLESINRNVKEGLFRVQTDGRMLYANVAFAQLFGFASPEEIDTFPLAEAVVDPVRFAEMRRTSFEQGQWFNEEAECRRRDGSTFWAMFSGTTVRTEAGEPGTSTARSRTSRRARSSRSSCASRRRWKRSASSPAAWRTTSTTCSR
ncbi:MAG: MASE1 domain-containing protein [Candidatus Eisenbacteria bacterium]|nr:MASE1 domain-containing protein [Candidatus Eisenbacteria bacterium]